MRRRYEGGVKVSVVIPVYNAQKTIIKTTESLLEQTYPPMEIILVDNGSTDGSYELILDFRKSHSNLPIEILKEEIIGSDRARNKGIGHAGGDIIAFTDSDCVLHKDWLKEIEAGFEDETIAGVAGSIYGFKPTNVIQKFSSIYTLRTPPKPEMFERYDLLSGGFATANLAIRKSILDRLGDFDITIDQGADHDLCRRILTSGFKIKYNPQAIVYHIHRPSLEGLLYQSFRFGTAQPHLLKKAGRMLVLELPRFTRIRNFPFSVWLNLNYADKKILFFLILGFFFWPAWVAMPLYILYLSWDSARDANALGINITFFERLLMGPLLVMKSFAMTMGRIYGSIKHKVICV